MQAPDLSGLIVVFVFAVVGVVALLIGVPYACFWLWQHVSILIH